MGNIAIRNQPCLKCTSSDARQIYEGGDSFCFSCSTYFKPESQGHVMETSKDKKTITNSVKIELEEIEQLASAAISDRKISKQVCEFYGVKFAYNPNGEISTHYYPYKDNGKVGYKKRVLPKTFNFIGDSPGLFGKELFAGGGKRLIIAEGEIDALSIAQASFERYGKFYPVIGLPSATGTSKLLEHRDWIRSFQEVVLCLDADTAGQDATQKAIKIVGIEKAKIVKLPNNCKDANEVLVKIGPEKLMQIVWDAELWQPANIVDKDKLWELLSSYNSIESVPYPPCLAGVNTKIKGMRPGEITLFISGTGSGKSTILREIGIHIIETTNDKIGIISLEESPAETARKLSGMAIQRNPAFEEIPLEDLKIGFDRIFGTDRVVVLDHQGSIKDSTLVDQLEYMALIGCKYLFIDHITILVSEGADGLTGNEAIDKVMNDLLRLTKKFPIWIGLVSHLRKTSNSGRSFEEGKLPSIDDIRGSGSIKQISHDIISFARNLTAEDEVERNSIQMRILKSRYTGLTGSVPGAYYTIKTGRLGGLDKIPDDDFDLA